MLDQWPGRVAATLRWRLDWKAIGYALVIAAAFVTLTILLHLPHGPQHWSADWITAHFSPRLERQHDTIKLVYVTYKTLEPYPYISPTNRKLLAELVRALDAAEPKVIGIDFVFDRNTEKALDDELSAAIRGASARVVLGAVYEPRPEAAQAQGNPEAAREHWEESFQAKFLADAGRPVGHLHFDEHHSILVISDHVVRSMAKAPGPEPYRRSLAEVLVREFEEASGKKPVTDFRPKSQYISWLLGPKNGSETFFSLSAERLLGRTGPPLDLKALFQGKIVLIGGDFFDRDQHFTPLSVIDDTRYPGIFIHAQILAQLLAKRSLETLNLPTQVLVAIGSFALAFWIGRRSRRNWVLFELLSVAGLVVIATAAFIWLGYIFPYNAMLLAWLTGAATGHYGRPAHG